MEFIRNDPLTRGALVTSHKIDLCAACRDQFDVLEPLSAAMGEVSSICKRDGLLHGFEDGWVYFLRLDARDFRCVRRRYSDARAGLR